MRGPLVTADLVRDLIRADDRARPRAQQTRIGPSQVGHPCDRYLGHTIAGTDRNAPTRLPLAAWQGTAMHAAMADLLDGHPEWDTELAVTLPNTGHLTDDGHNITGTLDAYHRPSRTIVDWKYAGDSGVKAARINGPADVYRVQVHLYAYALTTAGTPVEHVAVGYIPRSGDPWLVHVWTEPYDPALVAAPALARLDRIAGIVNSGRIGDLPTAAHYCRTCPYYLEAALNLTESCPGHAGPPSTP